MPPAEPLLGKIRSELNNSSSVKPGKSNTVIRIAEPCDLAKLSYVSPF
jgi:hypothetical protein